jgi:hypothetical protein
MPFRWRKSQGAEHFSRLAPQEEGFEGEADTDQRVNHAFGSQMIKQARNHG